MAKMDRSDKPDKGAFAVRLSDAFFNLAKQGKLGENGRHEANFAKICGTNIRTIRRWFDGENQPQRDSWKTAQAGLLKAGLSAAQLNALEAAARANEPNAPYMRDVAIIPNNNFPKLCSLDLDVPDQGSSPDDFVVIGEIRFARAPDVIEGRAVMIGVRRAVLLPVLKGYRVKPGSLYRPSRQRGYQPEGAGQVVFRAPADPPSGILEGDQMAGETLGRFLTTGEGTDKRPEVEFQLHLENPNDLRITLEGDTSKFSATQVKLAQAWVAQQIAQTVAEPDGSLRIGACTVRWKHKS